MEIKLMFGDCLERMKEIPDKSIDMILCDLPYGKTSNCNWDSVIPFNKLWEQYKRICKKNKAILLFGSEPFASVQRLSNIQIYKYDWIWNKLLTTGHLNIKKMPLLDYESISVFSFGVCCFFPIMIAGIPNDKPNKSLGTSRTIGVHGENKVTYTDYGTQKFPKRILTFQKIHSKCVIHPSQKPIDLCKYLIKTYTNENETVLDNCMGSASTGIACIETNRSFIGIEMDEEYFKMSHDRIAQYTNDFESDLDTMLSEQKKRLDALEYKKPWIT